jgi:hypothetical protein
MTDLRDHLIKATQQIRDRYPDLDSEDVLKAEAEIDKHYGVPVWTVPGDWFGTKLDPYPARLKTPILRNNQ